ncbi:membrane peptidoglycan carboxypeptidase [Arcanobacterium wilhelmae]|uniref:Membrane peptidoglycan carboxypeptidase n=1 Tax=Arcanobacterium wilhelmae TaxID=1803177 RepID=A0ABT9NB10_9ACTO|nr:transglycosylase domain-containing protein [Arcanobacterium wilhelmae]MDP9800893.1 membrane peptidoglycan carboxypeptidase [Arcanobacterium wilhelmae]WFN90260.1 transglycosylase domain-containing protein [Arcanobacterium wilhelmae]
MATSTASGKPKRVKGWNYPRAGYGPVHRWVPSWRVVVGSFLAFVALAIGGVVGLYVATKIPEPADFALAQNTMTYYSDGTTKLGTFSEVNRDSVTLDKMSPFVQHAVIASEDRRFFQNNGVDLKGIARAFWNNVRGLPTQGGSTLTQQYAERYYTGTNATLVSKAKEALLALKIDQNQSKEQILEKYLNTIYFGRGTYGIEAAAKAYFGVSAKDLTLEQSALIAGIIPAPSAWDPEISPKRAQQRYERVLNIMKEDGWITAEQYNAADKTMPQTIPTATNESLKGTTGYLVTTVKAEMINQAGFTEEEVNRGGYTITTTIDPRMQKALEIAVAELPADRPKNNYVGAVSMNPTNGEIVALYGGADYSKRQRNLVTQDRGQGGSTFKVFGLLAAVREGWGPTSRIPAPASYKVGNTTFNNVDGRDHGIVSLSRATAQSINTPFIIMNEKVGADKAKQAAIDLGLPENTPGLDSRVGNVLGSASPRPIDMIKVFGTLANDGKQATPHIIREVRDRDGNVVYSGPTTANQAVDANQVRTMNQMMQGVYDWGGTAEGKGVKDHPMAGKTGTSSGPWSAWIGGYTPQLATVVDMIQVGPKGEEERLTPFGGETQVAGGNLPGIVMHEYMSIALADMDPVKFPLPEGKEPPPQPYVPAPKYKAPPSPEPTREPTTEAPKQEQPQAPSPTSDAPKQQPKPAPSPTKQAPKEQPKPAPSPTQQNPAPAGNNK